MVEEHTMEIEWRCIPLLGAMVEECTMETYGDLHGGYISHLVYR